MPKLFGIDIAAIIHKEISPGVLDGTLYVDTAGARDTDVTAGITGQTTTTYSFKGIIQFFKDKEVDGELVLHSDRKFLITAGSLGVEPVKGNRITIPEDDGGVYQIVNVTKDPATATYVCQARL